MKKENENKVNDKKLKAKKKHKGLKIFLSIFLALVIVGTLAVGIYVAKTIADAPDIDPKKINSLLNQTSKIVDENGNLIEKIQTEEYRTIVSIDKIPQHLQDAFISIEDERFKSHIGVDPRGIMSSVLDNLKAGRAVRGASTITQQLSRNLYLSNEKKLDRKVKEAYIALKLEKALTKDQILEAYLNRIYLGQGAYGVQEASQTYFSKNVEDLSVAESAVLAGIVKSPTKYSVYKTVALDKFNPEENFEVGRLDILGDKYVAIYNEDAVKRQNIVLKKMLELNKITEEDYKTALNESIKDNIKPGQKKLADITSYFNDFIKSEVINSLINDLGLSKEEAEKKLYNGGLTIYSTMDLGLQRKLESIYENFTQVLLGNPSNIRGPAFISLRLNNHGNIIDNNGNVLFYKKANIMDEESNLVLSANSFEVNQEGLAITSPVLKPFQGKITINDYYTIDDKKNLVTHAVGNIKLKEENYTIEDNKLMIKKDFLDKNNNFYKISDNGNIIISKDFFYQDMSGIVQPQSASVLIDHRNGHIKALVGGRDVEGAKVLNRAIVPRQPGSSIKPLAAYLPALDNGFTAATTIDDVPFMHNGRVWPNNWYRGFRGLNSLRTSLEQSINVASVKTVNDIGIATSIEYLGRMGIVNKNNPGLDSFVSSSENPSHNDENLSALGLGGMSRGISPLALTGGFASVANDGQYLKPISFTKVLDSNGKVLIDNTPESNTVVSPEIAYIMKDILRTTVSNGIAGSAQIPNMTTAGKTGTTQEQADAWFAGFTPYYSMSTWIGNDIPQLKLNRGSSIASKLWRLIMIEMHEGLENKSFDRPADIVSVNVCSQSGKLPGPLCQNDVRGSMVRNEIFLRGTEPRETCDVHVSMNVCSASNLLASEYCPQSSLVSKSFIRRNPPYNPGLHGGIFPSDYEYSLPSSVCNVHTKTSIIDVIDDLLNGDENPEEEDPENGEATDSEEKEEENSTTEDTDNNKEEDNKPNE